ncbi:MAG: 4Fe-4S dicluster domain-containing protein [Thermoleophilia bacterium]
MTELTPSTLAKELNDTFIRDVLSMPDGDHIKICQQCGTCTGSCPTSHLMDYGPREVIAAFRAGQIDEVVKSNTLWLCTSCYACTVRCPAQIKITDLMYELKRLAIKYDLVPKEQKNPALTKYFIEGVHRHGRSAEAELMTRYMLTRDQLATFRFAGLGMKLLQAGRMPLLPKTIAGKDEIRAIGEYLDAKEEERA